MDAATVPPRETEPPHDPPGESALDRRAFLQALGAGAAAAAVGLRPIPARAAPDDEGVGGLPPAPARQNRAESSFKLRVKCARTARQRPFVAHASNGDELEVPHFAASYSKGLPHDALGHVDPDAYAALRRALETRDPAAFEAIPLGFGVKLTSPQAGLAFDLEGPDSHHVTIPPAPRFASAEEAAEMAEVYWMALARDVHFEDYAGDVTTQTAAADLTRFSDFRGPEQGGAVTPATLFRGFPPGTLVGPYVSQFLWLDVPYGPQRIEQRSQTTLPGVDHMADYATWLAVQNGADFFGRDAIDPQARYLRNLRDLARWVQIDALYQAYLNACLILLGMGCPLDDGNPLKHSSTQAGFAEWGVPHILSLVTEVATRALKAVWYQKWFVHRRLRPEAFAGRVHNHVTRAAEYPIHPELFESDALARVHSRFGTYLLPMAFPEGSPTHPAYGAGHATVAGACTTILKAWFDTSFVIPDPVVASADGTALLPYAGPALTVGNELDKVAANIAIGRNGAGVHWRTDYTESVRLGERVAIGILEEQQLTYNQDSSFTLTTFDGETIAI
jgi:hypothetical protein